MFSLRLHGAIGVLAALLLLSPRPSLAQPASTGFSAERLRVTPDRSGLIDVEFGRVLPHLTWDVGLHLGYARNPLVLYSTTQDGRPRLGSLVSDRLGGSLLFTLGLFDWVQVSVELPFILYQAGDREIPGVTTQPLPALRPLGLGDLRLVPKVRILRSEDHHLDLALQLSLFLPTGGGGQYFGDTSAVLAPEVALSRRFGGLRLAGNVAFALLRGPQTVLNLTTGDELVLRLGAGFRFHEHDASWIPLELDASFSTTTALSRPFTLANQQASELRLQGAWHFPVGLVAFLGAGAGLQPGWGTPDWRLFAGVRFALQADADGDGVVDAQDACPRQPGPKERKGCPATDGDGDGLSDDVDACPTEAEDVDGFQDADGCPDLDDDKDGVPDLSDRCPREAEDADGFEDGDGCPDPDNDQDGLADDKDRCPSQPEDVDGFEDADGCADPDNDQDTVLDSADRCPLVAGVPANQGCPDVDTDGDGLVDRLDTCPDEKGPADNGGCAKKQLALLKEDRVQIVDSVYFKAGLAVIEARSFPVLDNVARVLQSHPELSVVRIEGHTDSRGDDGANLRLSQSRAEAVVAYLAKRGVAPGRLQGVGYGETRPIASNETVPGRARNRRVEFNLGQAAPDSVKKDDRGPGTDTLERLK